jgi:hypothetical protein
VTPWALKRGYDFGMTAWRDWYHLLANTYGTCCLAIRADFGPGTIGSMWRGTIGIHPLPGSTKSGMPGPDDC